MDSALKDLRYLFKHALLCDTAYDMQLRVRLDHLHRMAARAIMQVHAPHPAIDSEQVLVPYYPDLAYHYDQAGEREQAARWYRRAGEQAAAQYAGAAAVAYLSRALDLTPEGAYAERYRLLLAREQVFHLQGARKAQAQDLETLRVLSESLSDDRQRIEVVLRKARYGLAVSDSSAAAQCLETALVLARSMGDQEMEVTALNGLGNLAWHQGAYNAAACWLEEGLSLARQCGDQKGLVAALYELSGVEWLRGDLEKAGDYAAESLALARKLGDRQGVAEALNRLGIAAVMQRAYEQARRYWAELLSIAQDMGDQRNIILGLNNLGYLSYLGGRYEAAIRSFEKALSVSREIGLRYMIAICLANLGTTYAAMNEAGAAWGCLLDGLRESVTIGSVHTTLQALVGIAWLRACAGQYQRAAELLSLVLDHPSLEGDVRQDTAAPLLFALRAVLSTPELEAAQERGKGLELEQVVAEMLDKPG